MTAHHRKKWWRILDLFRLKNLPNRLRLVCERQIKWTHDLHSKRSTKDLQLAYSTTPMGPMRQVWLCERDKMAATMCFCRSTLINQALTQLSLCLTTVSKRCNEPRFLVQGRIKGSTHRSSCNGQARNKMEMQRQFSKTKLAEMTLKVTWLTNKSSLL